MADDLTEMALEYHRFPVPGKLSVEPTKKLANQRDLALAYSPGVAAACNLIAADPNAAAEVTARGNLVAVVSNGTAVLGLGAIGPLAAKPVMEGKAVLFKKFAGIDVFDIEIDATTIDRMVDVISALEPTFGGINLEDIKAPECFEVERLCRERMNIPVFHDDQHGTAICVAAAVYNGLRLIDKKVEEIEIVCAGAGAAALACLNLLISLGAQRENITICDIEGVVYEGRTSFMDPYKAAFAQPTDQRTLEDAVAGKDLFLGLSAAGVLKADWIKTMAADPLILALANPTPEILPEEALAVRPDAILATGRSDYPNQVNNVLCFPFLFRGALDAGATEINEDMKIAAVKAIADLALAEPSDVVARAYKGEELRYGRDYLIPKPFDPRLITQVAPAVAEAAMQSGVATRPIADMEAYRDKLEQFVYKSGQIMRPVFEQAVADPKRVIYADGEDVRVLQAAQIGLDDKLVQPVLVGRRFVVEKRIEQLGLKMRLDHDVALIDPTDDPRYRDYWESYHAILGRKGVTPDRAREIVRTNATAIAALAVIKGDADAMLCGATSPYRVNLDELLNLIGLAPDCDRPASVALVITPNRSLFIVDGFAHRDPSAEDIAAMVPLAAEEVRRFGLEPKVALCAHASFGASDTPTTRKMREALALIRAQDPDFEVEGEMTVHVALDPWAREKLLPETALTGSANLLVMPDIDAANIAFSSIRAVSDGLTVGPILLGLARPAHVVSETITVRGLVNMTAIAVVDAQEMERRATRAAAE